MNHSVASARVVCSSSRKVPSSGGPAPALARCSSTASVAVSAQCRSSRTTAILRTRHRASSTVRIADISRCRDQPSSGAGDDPSCSISGSSRLRDSSTYPGEAASASVSHVPSPVRWAARSTVAVGRRGTSTDRCRQCPVSTSTPSALSAATVARRVFPIPASPTSSIRPSPASRCRRTTRSSSRRPAMAGRARVSGSSSSRPAASQRSWNLDVSPPSASTTSSSTPHAGSRAEENTCETVVWLHPASRASVRRLGQPARRWRSCRASTSSRWGPGGRSGRGSPPTSTPSSTAGRGVARATWSLQHRAAGGRCHAPSVPVRLTSRRSGPGSRRRAR